MGKNQKANKKYTKGKGITWKKGKSCLFNPEYNKHRQAAKKRTYILNAGNSNLTVDQLARHNKMIVAKELENDDAMSMGVDTALTGFTNCSLPTFDRLLKNWNSQSFLHMKMRALLEAVADVIKSKGEEESEAKYFSVLVVMLDDVDSDETLTAIICLLSMVIKRVNRSSLLALQKTPILETFTKLLIKHMNSDHCALLRNLLSILYAFLRLRTSWPEKCNELNVIFECTTHHKPKVRRAAHFIIRNLLLNCVPANTTIHPQAVNVANFCIQKLESKSSDSREVFYILNLLQEILCLFPPQNIKKTCETIIKVMTLSNSMVTSSCLKALKGLFSTKSSDTLSTDLNAKIISAMYSYQPNLKEIQCLVDWLQLMEAAFINLYQSDNKLCISHLPNFFSTAVKCWLCEREDVMQAVAVTLNNLLHTCIDSTHEVFQQFLFDDPVNNPMHKMFQYVEGALSYQYHKAWKYVIFVLGSFFEVMGKHCHTIMLKCLQSLADLHDSFKFPHINDVEKAIGIAIEHMGPRVVLSAIPLQIPDDKPDFPRSWLLPVLRDNIKRTELEFFCRYFLVLAKKMRNKALALKEEERVVESKLYDLICSQLWALLPGFCNEPTDLEKMFKEEEESGKKGLPRTLADVLRNEPTLRLTVLSAIRLLITKNIENEKHIETMAKFSNNYLPLLFNLYSPESKDAVEDKVRLAIYETIKVYLQITKKELCGSLFKTALGKLTEESDIFKQASLLDIAKAFLPYVDEVLIGQLYEFTKPLLMHSNNTLQKKAFSVIKEICSCDSETCRSFVKANRNDLRSLLSQPITTLPPATKALRLNCLENMVSQMTINEINFIEEIIPEVVLSTKENSVKARTAAFCLLVEIGHAFNNLMPDDPKGAMKRYISLLLAGLTGSAPPRLISATVLAIGRVLYEFKDIIDSTIIHLLIENMCLLLTSKSREVVVAALSFLKIIFASVDTLTLAQHVEFLVRNITNISEDNQRHFRFKAKEIFTRLIRKFGYEMISKFIPEAYSKQLANIRKLEARKQRKKNTKDIDSDYEEDKNPNDFDALLEDSDDEMALNDGMKQKQEKKLKKVKKSYLEEQDEDDIVDFMDPSASKKLTSMPMKGTAPVVTKPISSFPVSADGRIIIEDEEEKLKSKKEEKIEKLPSFHDLIKRKRKLEYSDDDITEDEEDEPTTETKDINKGIFKGKMKKGKKRVKRDVPSENISEVKSGIFRTLKPKAKKKSPGDYYKAKKAGGDVPKGGKLPHAYIPFNRQALNKRKQVKLKGQFNNLVKAAKKGARSGAKINARVSKKKRN